MFSSLTGFVPGCLANFVAATNQNPNQRQFTLNLEPLIVTVDHRHRNVRKVQLHQLFENGQLRGVGGPGAPHHFEFRRLEDSGTPASNNYLVWFSMEGFLTRHGVF